MSLVVDDAQAGGCWASSTNGATRIPARQPALGARTAGRPTTGFTWDHRDHIGPARQTKLHLSGQLDSPARARRSDRSSDKLEKVLNEHSSKGWALKAITSVEVKGRMGPGGVEGILITFEK